MHSISESSAPDRFRVSFRRRGTAILLALAVEALIVLLFLTFVPMVAPKEKPRPTIFGFDTDGGDAVEPQKETKPKERSKGGAGERTKTPTPVAPPITPPPPLPETKLPSDVIWLTREQYAAADIGKSRPQGAETVANDAGTGTSSAGDSEVAQGRGPHGETLYAAEWYREPTHTELSAYLPSSLRQNGWGLIACRTVANYRVEDCQELGDSPRGSGLAGAVRQAAWQFRVRPPRVGGKSLVGAWVSIRIDYTNRPEK